MAMKFSENADRMDVRYVAGLARVGDNVLVAMTLMIAKGKPKEIAINAAMANILFVGEMRTNYEYR